MTPDPRLLLPATRALLEGWCGPVVVETQGHGWIPGVTDDDELLYRSVDTARVYRESYDGDGIDHVRLDLSRAECRDRVARVVAAQALPGNDLAGTCPRWWCDWGRRTPTWSVEVEIIRHADDGRRSGGCVCRVWSAETGALDPNDDTRLPDGSRLVDALALAAVARQVLTPGGPDAR